ncbi:MAG TPA: hypothetical protein RMH99_18535, partial [Sandaracinaceae bacterium LLY-WYZ-13_1]|nr:hypothetical protein [Sandaracinaceae bacterium LLY-WYZ-13_1]
AAPAAPDAAKPEPGEPGGPSTPAKPALDPHTNRTMLGQPAPRRPAEAPKADAAKTPRDAPAAGIDAPSDVGAGGSEARARSAVVYPSDTGEQEALTLPTRQRSRGLAMGVLAVGVAVLLVGAGALLWTLLGGGSDLRATVEQGEDGELLVIEVPGAEEGTRVRFHGTERPLSAGTARFELSADDLTLGDNELSVDVVAPDGSVETHTVGLHLEMRVRADLGPLERTPPAIDVVVEAPPGSEVTLDGEDLALDEQGRGSRTFEIDGAEANAEGVVEHVVRYRITPPEGEPAQGELSTRIPLTTMQIDRPGSELVTDRDSVEVAGAVAPGANVTVDGEAVDVEMGRFLHTLELPEVGERTVEVVARSAGRAPHVERIQIRRVEDLEEEAARFEVNEDLTYARMAQNPSTYRGQPVRFEGVVYNVQVRQGRSVLQVLVADCPEGPRACPLWVTYPTATEAELQSRVRVLGTVAGEQQFRSESGAIRTVPRVDATFVLPARGR